MQSTTPANHHVHQRARSVSSLAAAMGLVLALLLGFSPLMVSAQDNGRADRRAYVEPGASGRVLVLLDDSVEPTNVAERRAVRTRQVYRNVARGFAADLTPAEVERLAQDPNVIAITIDRPVSATSQEVPTGVRRIGADQNATAGIGSGRSVNVDVAVFDSGIDPNHSDLTVAGGLNCLGGSSWADDYGHGTHVAGTIGARDNGSGVVGVAPGARLWSIKVLDGAGNGSQSSVICGLEWAIQRAGTIKVINMSLSGTGTSGPCNENAFHQAFCNTASAGIPVVVAAGNRSTNAGNSIPAAYPETITVSAFTDTDGRPGGLGPGTCGTDDRFAGFSNFGAVIDIAAPGSCIVSTANGGGLSTLSGTSMAAPHVAGAIALYKSTNPGAGPSAVRNWLLSSASQPQSSSFGFTGDPDGIPERVLWIGGSQVASPSPSANPTQAPTATATATARPTQSPTATATPVLRRGDRTPSGTATPSATQAPTATATPSDRQSRTLRTPTPTSGGGGSVSTPTATPAETRPVRQRATSVDGAAVTSTPTVSARSTRVPLSPRNVPTSTPTTTAVPVEATSGEVPAATTAATATSVPPTPTNTASVVEETIIEEPAIAEESITEEIVEEVVIEEPVVVEEPTVPATPPPYQIVRADDPDGYGYARYAIDGDPNTIWYATAPPLPAPEPIYEEPPVTDIEGDDPIMRGGVPVPDTTDPVLPLEPVELALELDLGEIKSIGVVRWLWGETGLADNVEIQVSLDGETWRTIVWANNAPAGEWQEAWLGVDARFVRFLFPNPYQQPVVGGLAEVEVYQP